MSQAPTVAATAQLADDEIVDTRDRLAWLCGLCRLPPLAAEILALAAGLRAELRVEPEGCTVAAAAALLEVGEPAVAAQLAPGAPLVSWGLVRTAGARVNVSPRIARFLLCGGRAAASA